MTSPAKKKQRVNPDGGESEDSPFVIMVTGGTGLVGRALEDLVKSDPNPKEKWVFLSSADGDLR